MMDLLREDVIGKTLETHIATLSDTGAAVDMM